MHNIKHFYWIQIHSPQYFNWYSFSQLLSEFIIQIEIPVSSHRLRQVERRTRKFSIESIDVEGFPVLSACWKVWSFSMEQKGYSYFDTSNVGKGLSWMNWIKSFSTSKPYNLFEASKLFEIDSQFSAYFSVGLRATYELNLQIERWNFANARIVSAISNLSQFSITSCFSTYYLYFNSKPVSNKKSLTRFFSHSNHP